MMTPDTGSMPGTALDTLGSTFDTDLGRDAIHLATVAVTSDERLFAGMHVGLVAPTKVSLVAPELVGIVDPFLTDGTYPNRRFWLVLYPRTITSLRHVWTHPSFPEGVLVVDEREVSRLWLEAFAERLFPYEPKSGTKFTNLISGAEYEGFRSDIKYDDDLKPGPEFWSHYERYTGRTATNRPTYFRCAC